MSIAITGVGGGVGQSIIKCLQEEYKLIGLDSEPLGTGLYCCNKSYIIPQANDDKYINEVSRICEKENCEALFPGLDVELPVLSRNIKLFKNTKIVVSNPTVVNICDNKLLTHEFLKSHKFPTPATYHLKDLKPDQLSFPFIIKPYNDARSKDVKIITKWDFTEIDKSKFIAQEYIEGDEYTCGSLNLDQYYGCVVMKRILRDGDTYKCFCVKNTTIENLIEKLVGKLQPFGALNIQLRVKNGVPYIFELNARCSGTTAARAMSGFNEPRLILDYLLYKIKPRFKVRETCILRYWKELIVPCGIVNNMEKHKEVVNIDPIDL